MKQQRLPLRRDKPALNKLADEADAKNLAVAQCMIDNPLAYQGIQLQWAERVMAKSKQKV